MKSLTEQLWFETPHRRDYLNITGTVEQLVRKSGVQEGLCLVNAMHITANVYINDAKFDAGRMMYINLSDLKKCSRTWKVS
jgi:thiamine phosphate synthase YjbQ (UPF0047 family)